MDRAKFNNAFISGSIFTPITVSNTRIIYLSFKPSHPFLRDRFLNNNDLLLSDYPASFCLLGRHSDTDANYRGLFTPIRITHAFLQVSSYGLKY